MSDVKRGWLSCYVFIREGKQIQEISYPCKQLMVWRQKIYTYVNNKISVYGKRVFKNDKLF